MCKIIKLPQNEFEIMKEIWMSEQPITSTQLMKKIGKRKKWKIQTLISHLNRLINKGFLSSYKEGNERRYIILISENCYLKQETENFLNLYHNDSLVSFLVYFTNKNKLTEEESQTLISLLDKIEED